MQSGAALACCAYTATMISLRRVIACTLVLTLVSLSAAARPLALLPAGAVVLDTDANVAATERLAEAKAASLQLKLGSEGAPATIRALAEIDDPLARELAAAGLVSKLQNVESTAASREVLVELAGAPTLVFRRHEETRGDWFVPLIDVAARAKFAQRALAVRDKRAEWAERLIADPSGALRDASLAPAEQRLLIAEAITELSAHSLASLEKQVLLDKSPQPTDVWRALAERSNNPAVYAAAADACSEGDLLVLVYVVTRQLAPVDAERWLLEMSERRPLNSAALLALAPRADIGSQAISRLIFALDSPTEGASAAAALATRPQADRLDLLQALAGDPDVGGQRLTWLALALRLEGSSEALTLLQGLAEHPRLPPSVRKELVR